MENEKKKSPKFCRLNRFQVTFNIENDLLKRTSQIMAKDLEKEGYWTEVNKDNLASMKENKAIVEFRQRLRPRSKDTEYKEPLEVAK